MPVKLPKTRFEATSWKLGVGYYERTVTLTKEQAARNVRISFESIGVHYRVWVNGRLAVDNPQSSSFLEQHDISAFVKPGENTIRISVDNKKGDDAALDLNGDKRRAAFFKRKVSIADIGPSEHPCIVPGLMLLVK